MDRNVRPRLDEGMELEPNGVEQVPASDPSELTGSPSTPENSIEMEDEIKELFGQVPDMSDSEENRRRETAEHIKGDSSGNTVWAGKSNTTLTSHET